MSAALSHLMQTRPVRALRRYWRCERGVTAIEFAFVSPILVAILLATTQVGVIFVAQSYLESVAEEGTRLVMTNQANSLTQAQFASAICTDVQSVLFNCNNIIVALSQAPSNAAGLAAAMPQFDTKGNLIGTPPYTISSAPTKMMLVVMYQWPVIGGPLGFNLAGLGNGKYLLLSTQVFQVEPPINSPS